ncbi:hypothetical protein L3Q82_015921, partial [Scortum barcoo]
MRVTAIHLSENALIPDPICPPPLGFLLPRGPCDPRCRPLDQASCPASLQRVETATAHLRPEAILEHCNTCIGVTLAFSLEKDTMISLPIHGGRHCGRGLNNCSIAPP